MFTKLFDCLFRIASIEVFSLLHGLNIATICGRQYVDSPICRRIVNLLWYWQTVNKGHSGSFHESL